MCSLVESSPFHKIITGAGRPAVEALVKYAGSDVCRAYGISTRVVAGSTRSKDFSSSSRQRR